MMKFQSQLSATCFRALLLMILFMLPFFINAQQYMRANLLAVTPNGAPALLDGNLTNYSPEYSNAVDIDDAWKMSNFGENFGILRNSQTLVVERRSVIVNTDTTFFRMWNMHQYNYQLDIITKHFDQPRLHAKLKDNYLNIFTEITMNDTTRIPFSVNNDPGSYNSLRFELIYYTANSVNLPVSFMDFKTYRKSNTIQVEWNVINEISVEKYIIEHSADGRNFEEIGVLAAMNTGSNNYNFTDLHPLSADNFYRLKAVRLTGNVEYSNISKVNGVERKMDVYPNPTSTRTVRLETEGKEAGTYQLSLININGISYDLKPVNIAPGQVSQVIDLPAGLVPGIYRLKVQTPGNHMQVISVYLL